MPYKIDAGVASATPASILWVCGDVWGYMGFYRAGYGDVLVAAAIAAAVTASAVAA